MNKFYMTLALLVAPTLIVAETESKPWYFRALGKTSEVLTGWINRLEQKPSQVENKTNPVPEVTPAPTQTLSETSKVTIPAPSKGKVATILSPFKNGATSFWKLVNKNRWTQLGSAVVAVAAVYVAYSCAAESEEDDEDYEF